MSEPRLWTGETRPADPGWRAARRELTAEGERRSLVAVVAWGVPRPMGDLVPLGAVGERLDGPGLLHVAPPGMSDEAVWALLARSSVVAAEIDERMRLEEDEPPRARRRDPEHDRALVQVLRDKAAEPVWCPIPRVLELASGACALAEMGVDLEGFGS